MTLQKKTRLHKTRPSWLGETLAIHFFNPFFSSHAALYVRTVTFERVINHGRRVNIGVQHTYVFFLPRRSVGIKVSFDIHPEINYKCSNRHRVSLSVSNTNPLVLI